MGAAGKAKGSGRKRLAAQGKAKGSGRKQREQAGKTKAGKKRVAGARTTYKRRVTHRAIPAYMADRHTVRVTKSNVTHIKQEIMQYHDSNGYVSWSAKERKYIILGTNMPKGGLVQCPECKVGQLMVVRSRSSGKRFMGCSNFYGGCDASSPLLQKARLRATKKPCDACGWPIVIFRYSRNQKWSRQCANINCPSRNMKP